MSFFLFIIDEIIILQINYINYQLKTVEITIAGDSDWGVSLTGKAPDCQAISEHFIRFLVSSTVEHIFWMSFGWSAKIEIVLSSLTGKSILDFSIIFWEFSLKKAFAFLMAISIIVVIAFATYL